MDTATARKRLEEICHDLDRSITVLQGENHREEDASAAYQRDPADAGANLSEADRSQAVLEAAQRQRTEVVNALSRLDTGAYGTCVDCGDSVPDGRLEAKPEAARCVRCQSKHDRQRH
ncbi:MAG TPA: TraR/DksA C4-type zinc finger protein [Streptosporangiaceae bacterium]